jgi:hypothetical protein
LFKPQWGKRQNSWNPKDFVSVERLVAKAWNSGKNKGEIKKKNFQEALLKHIDEEKP